MTRMPLRRGLWRRGLHPSHTLKARAARPQPQVERGRELRADYKLVARALTRKGNALVKQNKVCRESNAAHRTSAPLPAALRLAVGPVFQLHNAFPASHLISPVVLALSC